jgi:hypothetical protein
MIRPLAVLLVLVVTLTTQGAPGLKSKPSALYFPTGVGARWVYEYRGIESTTVVTRVEEKDGAFLVEVAEVSRGQETPAQQMRVSPDGVFRLSIVGTTLPNLECILKLPYKDGQEWDVNVSPVFGGAAKLTMVGWETVETPAGKFDAIRVDRLAGGQTNTYWFAEGIGVVKYIHNKSEGVLKSFTPGTKK